MHDSFLPTFALWATAARGTRAIASARIRNHL